MTRRSLTAYSLIIGMPALHRRNAKQFYARALFYEKLFGPLITYGDMRPKCISWQDIQRAGEHVVAGVPYEVNGTWTARMLELFIEEQNL